MAFWLVSGRYSLSPQIVCKFYQCHSFLVSQNLMGSQIVSSMKEVIVPVLWNTVYSQNNICHMVGMDSILDEWINDQKVSHWEYIPLTIQRIALSLENNLILAFTVREDASIFSLNLVGSTYVASAIEVKNMVAIHQVKNILCMWLNRILITWFSQGSQSVLLSTNFH